MQELDISEELGNCRQKSDSHELTIRYTHLMNTELETKFIQLLKCGLLDKLKFEEATDGRVIGFSFCYDCYGHELTANYGFRSEGDKIILIVSYWPACYQWGKYINLRRGLPNRDDILKVECKGVARECNVECIIDIESIDPQNVQQYLKTLEHDIWDSAEPIKVKERNYLNIDWSNVVAYNIDHPHLIAIDRKGCVYDYVCKSSPIIDNYLGEYLGEAYNQMILPRGIHEWPDSWHTYKRSNGHCLYIKEEYSQRLSPDLKEVYKSPKTYYEILTAIVDMVLEN